MNVALTRAKRGLIVVGPKKLLTEKSRDGKTEDTAWRPWLKWIGENSAVFTVGEIQSGAVDMSKRWARRPAELTGAGADAQTGSLRVADFDDESLGSEFGGGGPSDSGFDGGAAPAAQCADSESNWPQCVVVIDGGNVRNFRGADRDLARAPGPGMDRLRRCVEEVIKRARQESWRVQVKVVLSERAKKEAGACKDLAFLESHPSVDVEVVSWSCRVDDDALVLGLSKDAAADGIRSYIVSNDHFRDERYAQYRDLVEEVRVGFTFLKSGACALLNWALPGPGTSAAAGIIGVRAPCGKTSADANAARLERRLRDAGVADGAVVKASPASAGVTGLTGGPATAAAPGESSSSSIAERKVGRAAVEEVEGVCPARSGEQRPVLRGAAAGAAAPGEDPEDEEALRRYSRESVVSFSVVSFFAITQFNVVGRARVHRVSRHPLQKSLLSVFRHARSVPAQTCLSRAIRQHCRI